ELSRCRAPPRDRRPQPRHPRPAARPGGLRQRVRPDAGDRVRLRRPHLPQSHPPDDDRRAAHGLAGRRVARPGRVRARGRGGAPHPRSAPRAQPVAGGALRARAGGDGGRRVAERAGPLPRRGRHAALRGGRVAGVARRHRELPGGGGRLRGAARPGRRRCLGRRLGAGRSRHRRPGNGRGVRRARPVRLRHRGPAAHRSAVRALRGRGAAQRAGDAGTVWGTL
ncbi:MAG: hypothetical protein AVDCRST_MAG68-2483, partial [uncultured Gemmatimonadetes bacterium]